MNTLSFEEISLGRWTLVTLPAFDDNYLWLLHDGKQALVVDPGDAAPVQAALDALQLQLGAILVTHHHADHVGGVDVLRDAHNAAVYGPAYENIPEPVIRVGEGQTVSFAGLDFAVLEVPGHTAGHIAYFHNGTQLGAFEGQPLLFCGDTLFSGGCGRLFEGTPAQMLLSLQTLSHLPDETLVCCAHEYTLSNLRFAVAVDPDNTDLQAYQAQCQAQRALGKSTIPSRVGVEKKINPFLRCHTPQVQNAVRLLEVEATFAALRQWKNEFK